MELTEWFLTEDKRGNPSTSIGGRHRDSWSAGNRCTVLVDGANYFRRLREALDGLNAADSIFFTDWRSDPDELLGASSSMADALCRLASGGVRVHGLLWRSQADQMRFSQQKNVDSPIRSIALAASCSLMRE